MPWTPVPKFPEVISNLKKSGRANCTGTEALEVEIIRTIGLTKDVSIKRMIELMERLGFIHRKITQDGVILWFYEKAKESKIDDEFSDDELKKYGV